MDDIFSRPTQPGNLPDEALTALLEAAEKAVPGPYWMEIDAEDNDYCVRWRETPNALWPLGYANILASDTYYPIAPDRDTMSLFTLCDPATIRALVTELAVLRKLNRG